MTLAQQCLELPYRDRLNLYTLLQESLKQERTDTHTTNTNRGGVLMGIMEEIIGEKVPVNSRKYIHSWARAMVAYQLLKEGMTTLEAGRILHRDHSTITFLKHKVQAALDYPYAYREIFYTWTQFQNKIQQ